MTIYDDDDDDKSPLYGINDSNEETTIKFIIKINVTSYEKRKTNIRVLNIPMKEWKKRFEIHTRKNDCYTSKELSMCRHHYYYHHQCYGYSIWFIFSFLFVDDDHHRKSSNERI